LAASGVGVADDEPRPLTRMALGSCARQNQPQPIWEPIVAAKPGFQKLRATCPILATWDDHDYGADDAGAEYPMKVESQKLFLDFFHEPPDSPRRQRRCPSW
jgi:alkaline phosphatase D